MKVHMANQDSTLMKVHMANQDSTLMKVHMANQDSTLMKVHMTGAANSWSSQLLETEGAANSWRLKGQRTAMEQSTAGD